ncbi:hypothetical protein SDJN03_28963, partial [Cucurbita argyrosperma subsp. sororia]
MAFEWGCVKRARGSENLGIRQGEKDDAGLASSASTRSSSYHVCETASQARIHVLVLPEDLPCVMRLELGCQNGKALNYIDFTDQFENELHMLMFIKLFVMVCKRLITIAKNKNRLNQKFQNEMKRKQKDIEDVATPVFSQAL